MKIIPVILSVSLFLSVVAFSQNDSSGVKTDSLKIKVNSTVEKWIKERPNNDSVSTRSAKDTTKSTDNKGYRISEQDSLSADNTLVLNKSKKKNYGRWEPDDLVFEYVLGGGMGILGGLIGGMLGSFAHTTGDTTQSGNDAAVDVVLVMMSIGHAIGTPFGVNIAAKKNGAKGEIILGILGTLLGDASGIYLIAKGKKWTGIGVITLVTPLISTLFFNLADGSK
jgi:hypothetical protein